MFCNRKKKKFKVQITAVTLGSILLSGSAYAAAALDETAEEYELGQVVVTAKRHESRDVDTPSAVSVVTSQQLQATGATNVLEALKLSEGLVYSSFGPAGASQSTMTSKLMIRGVTSGTLVLVNGTPLNLRGLYNLEDIPVDSVERVEIVKGGGSVLYGSEATGGVINIITKKKLENSVRISGGNFGQQDHSLSLQLGKLGLGYNYQNWDDVGKISDSTANKKTMNMFFPGSEKENSSFVYQFDEYAALTYSHNDSKYLYDYKFGDGYADKLVGKSRYDRTYNDKKDFVQFQYNRDHLKSTLYYNQKKLNTQGTDYYSSSGGTTGYPSYTDKTDKNRTYGLDFQQDWKIKENKLLMGFTYQNEYYTPDISKAFECERDNYSVYGQWEQKLGIDDTLILSGRETWTANAPNDRNYDNFSGQGQFLHKLNEEESLYASVGQSFMMPTFAQMYNANDVKQIGNPDLKPQTGIHYEVGWKKNADRHQWRVALFDFRIKDNITSIYNQSTEKYTYTNEDFKNAGIEISCGIQAAKDWSFNWGVAYGNPQTKSTDKPYWDRNYGRWQLNGSATYQHDRWKATLTGNYLADRVMTPSSSASYAGKPYLLTSLNVNYAVDKNQDIFVTVNNVLDRDDVISNSSSDYFYTPVNFTIGYKSRF